MIQTNQLTVDEIKKVIAENPSEGNVVRIYLAGSGCSGPSFGLALDEKNQTDAYEDQFGQGFVMEKDFFEQFGDFRIEFDQDAYLVQPVTPISGGGCSSCGGSCGA